MRIYITGASGTGTTTLGRALAAELRLAHVDTDAAYWEPTEVPFTVKAPPERRVKALRDAMGDGDWVWSGSADGWGDALIAEAGLVVFLTLPWPQRLARLKARERARHGARIAPGGDMERVHRAFMSWAASYDDPWFGGRSLARHRLSLCDVAVPVLELQTSRPIDALVGKVRDGLALHALT